VIPRGAAIITYTPFRTSGAYCTYRPPLRTYWLLPSFIQEKICFCCCQEIQDGLGQMCPVDFSLSIIK